MSETSAGAKYNMLNHLQAPSRLLVRASIALFTAIVLLLIQSAFWSARVSVWMQIVILAMALVTYFRPQYGLLALTALVPFGRLGSGTLDSQMRGSEALVLAFLAGALVRGWTLREFRSFPATLLETAALVFGFIVAASCVEQIWFMQIQQDFAWPFLQEVLTYASRSYLTSFRGYGTIFNAMLLLEGLALLLLTARYTREQPSLLPRLVVMTVVGAVATALFTVVIVTAELLSTGDARTRFVEFFVRRRWSVHIGDVNAAGSFFGMGMLMAFGLAFKRVRHPALWIAAGLLLAGTTWLTHSRTAIVGIGLVAIFLVAWSTLGRILSVGKTIAVTGFVAVAAAIALWAVIPRQFFGPNALEAIEIRWLFLGTTWRMLLAEPLFGVGVGQFGLWSNRFGTPALFKYYARENAHNNFAQIAGELGWIGLAAFVAVLALALWRRRDTEVEARAFVLPALLGLVMFILTWLGGHPLLVPEAAYPFWIVLAVVSLSSSKAAQSAQIRLIPIALACLVISLPLRVHHRAQDIDFAQVSYGLTNGRLTSARARIFVPAERAHVEIPLRARAAGEDQHVLVDVFVDDMMTNTVRLTDRAWQRTRIDFPIKVSGKFHQLELRIRPLESEDVVFDPRRDDVEVGKWEIISKPNG